jgi:type IV pilus assembly protein PilE
MSARGITLLELLVVLLILGVLAALAVPAYHRHVLRVHRSEAMVALLALAMAQERFHSRHGVYASQVAAPPPGGLGLPGVSEHGRYALSVSSAMDGQSFIATATPTDASGQSQDEECLAFSIDHRGRRAVSGTGAVSSCWR